jgi:hypothetical protein
VELRDEYAVGAPTKAVWEALDDIAGVAPLVPGFTLERVDGDTVTGAVKVKVGAMTASYNVEIDIVERAEGTGRIVLSVSGRERRGPGSMQADVAADVVADGAATTLRLVTTVNLTGRVAQLGSGVIGDVSTRLLEQFVTSLEARIAAVGAPQPPDTPALNGHAPPAEAQAEIVDLGAVATQALLRRGAPVAIGALLAAVLVYALRRGR